MHFSIIGYNSLKQSCGAGAKPKLLTCEIPDFTPCAHAQRNILHIKYAENTNDWDLGFTV